MLQRALAESIAAQQQQQRHLQAALGQPVVASSYNAAASGAQSDSFGIFDGFFSAADGNENDLVMDEELMRAIEASLQKK